VDFQFLLDTCVVSETSKEKPNPRVVRWIRITPRIAIPMGAMVEFEQGIQMKKETNPSKFAALVVWRDELLAMGIPFVDTDYKVAMKFGEMRACKQLKNLWMPNPELQVQRGGQDLHIAAAAIVFNASVATMNISDFMLIHQHFPLPGLFDPTTGVWHVKRPPTTRQVDVPARRE
jgi:predicted nucleic acid-binding protein